MNIDSIPSFSADTFDGVPVVVLQREGCAPIYIRSRNARTAAAEAERRNVIAANAVMRRAYGAAA